MDRRASTPVTWMAAVESARSRDGDGAEPPRGKGTADLFNSTLGAVGIAAMCDLGLFDELSEKGRVTLEEFCDGRDLDHSSVSALLRVLEHFEIVERDGSGDNVQPGRTFLEAYKHKGYFLWLVRGYGYLVQNASAIVKRQNRTGDFIKRNGGCIAMAARDYGSQFVDSHFLETLSESPYTVAADLGCGSAERLVQLAKGRPDFRGVGIDINPEAVRVARHSVSRANLQDRITVIQADVRQLIPQREYLMVDVLFCFFMGHDLWPRAECVEAFRRIRAAFPHARRFLFCDTYRSDLEARERLPIFTLGFELTHALMGQYVPSASEWLELFREAGWNCVGRRDIGIPFSSIFDLR